MTQLDYHARDFRPRYSRLAIAGLTLGLLLVLQVVVWPVTVKVLGHFPYPVGVLAVFGLPLLNVLLSLEASGRIKRSGGALQGRPLALAGVWLSLSAVLLAVGVVATVVFVFSRWGQGL